MRILFVVPYVPSQIRVRPFNFIRHLSARGHEVTVATIWTNARERQEADALRGCGANVRALPLPTVRSLVNCMRALPGREPLQARYSWSPELLSEVQALRTRADVVHVEHLRGVQYGLAMAASGGGAMAPVIWDSVDCITDLFEQAVRTRRGAVGRAINRLELSRTRGYEGAAVSRFARVLVSSARDRASLIALWRAVRHEAPAVQGGVAEVIEPPVSVVSNGVDLEYFSPSTASRQPNSIVFSGKMSYHANESAVLHLVREIMPIVWSQRPAARLVVVGKDPSRELRRLAADHGPRVRLTGTVPDLRPYLQHASVAVAPLVYGVGCQNKVLEAMACGTPVVATPRALAALQAEPGREALAAEGPQAFADAVISLLDHQRRRQAIGQAGRAYVETHHRWDGVAANLEGIYEGVLDERGAAPRRPDRPVRATIDAAAPHHILQ